MQPLWRMETGRFAGFRDGEQLYDARGRHIGYFEGKVAYSLSGSFLGTIFQNEWIGQRAEGTKLESEARPAGEPIEAEPRPDREKIERWGISMKGWVDPNF